MTMNIMKSPIKLLFILCVALLSLRCLSPAEKSCRVDSKCADCISLTGKDMDGICRFKYENTIIDVNLYNPVVISALDFLKENKPLVYSIINSDVPRIFYAYFAPEDTLHSDGSISLSHWCLREGALYTAAVLYHEVLHLVCREMRYPESLEERYRLLLEDEGITTEKAGRDYGLQEERFVYTKELDFLIRFRAPRRVINKTREDLRFLDETYKDLK